MVSIRRPMGQVDRTRPPRLTIKLRLRAQRMQARELVGQIQHHQCSKISSIAQLQASIKFQLVGLKEVRHPELKASTALPQLLRQVSIRVQEGAPARHPCQIQRIELVMPIASHLQPARMQLVLVVPLAALESSRRVVQVQVSIATTSRRRKCPRLRKNCRRILT